MGKWSDKRTFQETAFNKDGKFNVYLMDKVSSSGRESQNIDIVFISHDGETVHIWQCFGEDLVLKMFRFKGEIVQWIKEGRETFSQKDK